jgi:Putative beta-barrel porin-2, OmpL-like. bbp2
MKISRTAMAAAVACLLAGAEASAQQAGSIGLRQPTSARQTSYEGGGYYYADEEAAESPSDAPEAPSAADAGGGDASVGGSCNSCGTCDTCCGDDEQWRLFDSCALDRAGVTMGGWINSGFTWNPDSPADRFNGPVTFNDRSNEFQLNQLYLYAERAVDTGGCGSDLGGRIDVLYGTDWRFTPALGLETNNDGTMDWNQTQRFYGVAIPQMYATLGYNDLTVKIGHFYTIIGYEVVTAPDGFFYSHAYTHQYGEPFTHTGALAQYALNDNVSVSAGLHRGWDQWEDANNSIGGLGGVTWTSDDAATSVAFAVCISHEPGAAGQIEETRYVHSLVASRQLYENLKYVFESDVGHQQNALAGGQDAEWYGINQYLFYDINNCWALGTRGEWFRDDDGFRVAGIGSLGGEFAGRDFSGSGFVGDFYEIATGLNYKPNANVIVRGELRWDWFDREVDNQRYPFDDQRDGSQFLLGTDLIVRF